MLTHSIPEGWPRPGSTVHFVRDGLESAVQQAKVAAGGKSVGVHGANTIQQLLNAGPAEVSVDIAAVLLGSRIRLFDHLSGTPAFLGDPMVIRGVGVTHSSIRSPEFIVDRAREPSRFTRMVAAFREHKRPESVLRNAAEWRLISRM